MNYLYVIEVAHPLQGPILVGPWYRNKEACKSWVPFVKAAWHCRARTRKFSRKRAEAIQANGGQLPTE